MLRTSDVSSLILHKAELLKITDNLQTESVGIDFKTEETQITNFKNEGRVK